MTDVIHGVVRAGRRRPALLLVVLCAVGVPVAVGGAAAVAQIKGQNCSLKGYHIVYSAERARVLKSDTGLQYKSCDVETRRVWDIGGTAIDQFDHAGPWLLFTSTVPTESRAELVAQDLRSGRQRLIFDIGQRRSVGNRAVTPSGTVVYESFVGGGVFGSTFAIVADTEAGQTIQLDVQQPGVSRTLAVSAPAGTGSAIAYWRAAGGSAASADLP